MNYEEYRAVRRQLNDMDRELSKEEDALRATGHRREAHVRVQIGWWLQNQCSELATRYPEFSLRYDLEVVAEILSKGART